MAAKLLVFALVLCLSLALSSACDHMQKGKPDITCRYQAEAGPCKALHERYYYNIRKDKCEMFIYGGCAGNANNFLTAKECNEYCKDVSNTT